MHSDSDLAVLYNDKSILENHHASVTFSVLQRESCNLLAGLSKPHQRQARAAIISMILSTDMAVHFDLLHALQVRTTPAPGQVVAEPFNGQVPADRQLMQNLIVHAADISHPAKPFSVSRAWTLMCDAEFAAQVEAERMLVLPISQHLAAATVQELGKREVGFIDFIIEPLWKQLAEALPELGTFYAHVEVNRREWQRVRDGLVDVPRVPPASLR